MEMATNGSFNNNETQIVIVDDTHPLADSQSSTITVGSSNERFTYATGLASDALTIATTTTSSEIAIFRIRDGSNNAQ